MLKHLTLTEHATQESVELTEEQVANLTRLIPGLSIAPRGKGLYDVTPGSTVGAVVTEGMRVDIAPKIPIASLFYLLSMPFDHRIWRDEPVETATANHLVEAFVPALLWHVERALAKGPLRRYRVIEERRDCIRGRILLEEQLRIGRGLPLPVSVRYDDFTADITENRLFYAALRKISAIAVALPHKRRIARLLAALEEVSLESFAPNRLPLIEFDRLNEHYRPALDLATLVLRSLGLEHRAGGDPSVAFLVDMNKAFEDFVVEGLRRGLDASEGELVQGSRGHKIYLDASPGSSGKVRLLPDISWWSGPKCLFVADAKYKRLNYAGFKHGDLYQLLAYLVALDLESGLLIYPTTEVESASYQVPLAGKVLHIHTVDLSGSPREIEQSMAKLCDDARALRLRTTRAA